MVFELPNSLIIIFNIIAWLAIHLGVSLLALQIPDHYFSRKNAWFNSFKWEKDGQFWEDSLHIRQWKDALPDSSSIFTTAFNKKKVARSDKATLEKFVIETQRAEWTHWVSMLPAPLFFIWNPVWAGWLMILYALIANLPFIIIQRYNRPRLLKLIRMSGLR